MAFYCNAAYLLCTIFASKHHVEEKLMKVDSNEHAQMSSTDDERDIRYSHDEQSKAPFVTLALTLWLCLAQFHLIAFGVLHYEVCKYEQLDGGSKKYVAGQGGCLLSFYTPAISALVLVPVCCSRLPNTVSYWNLFSSPPFIEYVKGMQEWGLCPSHFGTYQNVSSWYLTSWFVAGAF